MLIDSVNFPGISEAEFAVRIRPWIGSQQLSSGGKWGQFRRSDVSVA